LHFFSCAEVLPLVVSSAPAALSFASSASNNV
jgi:hypothetical protein